MAAFGPVIAGYVYDATGSYAAAFILGAVLNAAAFFLLLALKKPVYPASSSAKSFLTRSQASSAEDLW